ncbi:MAG: CoA-binding protein [Lewinellaceae bacterium]|nr:CoA-binding protein [Lewinellaceae bacterium]
MKKTLVLGASPNSSRVSFDAVLRLQRAGHPVVAIGARPGEILGTPIITGQPPIEDIHTVTLYLNAERQREYYDYILQLKPQRLIFNPGTENPELSRLAREAGIATEIACTLVMLSVQAY